MWHQYFCGSLILRMAIFCVCFAGLIFAIGETVCSSLELISAISGSRLLFGIITFSFFEYKQSNAGEQHADV